MERQPRFDLNTATATWLDELRQSGTLTDDDLRELHGHLLDSIEALKAGGLSEEEAFLVARHRLGSNESLGAEFGKIRRPFAVQREPVIFLLGALAFVVLKNGLDAAGFGLSRWLVTHLADDRAVALADFGVRLLLFAVFVAALVAYLQRGDALHRRVFAALGRAPVGAALALTALVSTVQFLWFFGAKNVDWLLRDIPDRHLYDLRLNERLFAYGVYVAWLLALAWVGLRQRGSGKRPVGDWFRQAHAVPLLLLGWGVFLGFFVGVGYEVVHRFAGISDALIATGASLLFCLTAGFILAPNRRYSPVVRVALAVAPVLVWCSIGFVENPSEALYFFLRNGSAALVGAWVGLGVGMIREKKKTVA